MRGTKRWEQPPFTDLKLQHEQSGKCTNLFGRPTCWCSGPALMHSRSFAGVQFQSVPAEQFVLFFGLLRSSFVCWLQLSFIHFSSSQQMQPAEKKQARLHQLFRRNKKKTMSPWTMGCTFWSLLLNSTHGGAVLSASLESNIYFDKTQTWKGGKKVVHMFFVVCVKCNNFFLYCEGNILHLDQMPVCWKTAWIIKHENINQLINRLFQIWNKCINKWWSVIVHLDGFHQVKMTDLSFRIIRA